jgi:hypothetical protein
MPSRSASAVWASRKPPGCNPGQVGATPATASIRPASGGHDHEAIVLAFWKVWSRCSTSTANRGPVHAGRFDSSAFRCPWNGDLRRDHDAVALA